MPRYLVTGGCGFIGTHLVKSFQSDGCEVIVLDDLSNGRAENIAGLASLIVGDVADSTVVRRAMAGVDGCVHLAAVASTSRSNEDWLGTHRSNLTGTIAILDAARARDGRPAIPVVYASSAAVYGDTAGAVCREDGPTHPMTAYGADKLGSEIHARVGWTVHRVPSTGLRLFNVYGPGQAPDSPYSGVISIFMDRLQRRLPLTIFGDGGQERDFIYIDDVVRFLRRALATTADGAKVYNVCTGRAITISELASLSMSVSGVRMPVHPGAARIGDIRRSLGAPERATAALGLSADVSIETGLARLLQSGTGSGADHHSGRQCASDGHPAAALEPSTTVSAAAAS